MIDGVLALEELGLGPKKEASPIFRQIGILAMPSAHLNGDFFIGASLTHLTYLTTLA